MPILALKSLPIEILSSAKNDKEFKLNFKL